MYILLAEADTPEWSGEIARKVFASLVEAEAAMKTWARFGVDGYCNEADRIGIFDAQATQLRRWNWTTGQPEAVTAGAAIA